MPPSRSTLRRTLAVLVGLAVAVPAGVVANEMKAACEARLEPTELSVSAALGTLDYDHRRDTEELTRDFKGKSKGAAAPVNQLERALGLTTYKTRVHYRWGASTLKAASGEGCLRPKIHIEVVLDQTVSVGREFPPGTCSFDEIMRHEQLHVATNRAHLQAVARRYERELRVFFGNTVFYGDVEKLGGLLEQSLKIDWIEGIKAELTKVEALHQAIDTPREYARNRTLCDGAMTRQIRMQ